MSRVFYSDTDGIYAVFKEEIDRKKLITYVNEKLKEKHGIRFSGEIEGTGVDLEFYPAILFLTHKNYIYLDEKGKFKAKGSKLVSRSYPKISVRATKDILETYLKEGIEAAKKKISAWKIVVENSNDPSMFVFTIQFKKAREYKDKYHKAMAKKFGEGYVSLFVGKKGRSSYKKYKPKPREQYASVDEFSFDKLDRNWYRWHLVTYMMKSVCGLDFEAKRLDEFF